MSEWRTIPLRELGCIATSNVDKKTNSGERGVLLCNYMDVYSNEYITEKLDFMEASATTAEIAKFRVERGDVMITKDSETPFDIGIPAVVIDEIPNLVCGYHLAHIKPHTDLVDPTFLSKQLASHQVASYFSQVASGSTRYGLSSGAIGNTPILLASLKTQRRITEILTTVDEAIEHTEALIAKMQQIKAGLMHDLFTRGVTEDGKLRPPRSEAPELYKETVLGWIPREWEVRTTLSCAAKLPGSTTIGPFGSNLVASDYRKDGTPVVFVRDVKAGGFEWKSSVYVSPEKALSLAAHSVLPGDIISTKMGLPPCISCLYPDWMPPGIVTADIIRLRPDPNLVDAKWMSVALNSTSVRRQVEAITAGVTRPKVTLSDFRTIKLACPRRNEQSAIADRIGAIERVLAAESERRNILAMLKVGLMGDLLSGQVEVFGKKEAS